jgi:hypothetical protein
VLNRLAGAVLISPAVNYWWHNLPSNLTNEAYSRQLQQDQWSLRVAHYLPWLTYWWNTRTWFPGFSVIAQNPAVFSPADIEVLAKLNAITDPKQVPSLEQLTMVYEITYNNIILIYVGTKQ